MHPNEKYREKVHPFLESKCRDFSILGYENVTVDSLWDYLLDMKWKETKETDRIHQVVADIAAIKGPDYMNYQSLDVIKRSTIAGSKVEMKLNADELKELF